MGNCSNSSSSKNNDYNGGFQAKSIEKKDFKKKGSYKLKRSSSNIGNDRLSTSQKNKIDKMVSSKRNSSLARKKPNQNKKKSWIFGRKSQITLSNPAKVLFEECKKDALEIGEFYINETLFMISVNSCYINYANRQGKVIHDTGSVRRYRSGKLH